MFHAYRYLHGTAPALADSIQLVTMVEGRRCLRSADAMELLVPATRCKTLGDRTFPVVAARAWNALPPFIRLLRLAAGVITLCFVDVLKLNCFAIHTLRDTSIFFVFVSCLFIFMFIILPFVKCPQQ